MHRFASVLTLALLAACGCGNTEEPAENVASPSEGAAVINQNPTTPPVDVPSTPTNEAATAPETTPAPAGDTAAP